MQVDQEASDYIDGLQNALKEANQFIWFATKAAGGLVVVQKDQLAAFNPDDCYLERVEDKGSVSFLSREPK